MKVIAYHFWSPTCQPCKVIKPVIEDLKEEFNSVEWHSINTHEDSHGIAPKFGVTIVPTIVVTVGASNTFGATDNVNIQKHSGTQTAAYYRILRNALRT